MTNYSTVHKEGDESHTGLDTAKTAAVQEEESLSTRPTRRVNPRLDLAFQAPECSHFSVFLLGGRAWN